MNRQDSLPKFATEENSDIQQFENARDEARSRLQGTDTAMRRPQETARWFTQTAGEIASELALAEKAIGPKAGNEFTSTATDLKILAGLARYYAARLPAAVAYNVYKESGNTTAFDDAIADEKRAVEAWRDIVAAAGDVYNERLPFGARSVGFRQHWKEELALLDQDFTRSASGAREGAGQAWTRSGSARPGFEAAGGVAAGPGARGARPGSADHGQSRRHERGQVVAAALSPSLAI